jgi:hypothetical protein
MNPRLTKEFRFRSGLLGDFQARMNPRLAKEFRALRLPWLVGLAAGLAMLDHRAQDYAMVAAVGCAALLAAMSMGNEFQQRTLALLLSQPCARRDLWREKLLVLGMLAGTLGLTLFSSLGIAGREVSDPHDLVMTGIFSLAVVCSAPFWTLVARSIIGGMVFSLAGALLLLLVTEQLVVGKIFGSRFEDEIPDAVYAWAWLITGVSYSVACLLAGWRKFARLELKDAMPGESALFSTAATRRSRWWHCLRIRPAGKLRNLVRKELRLQKPGVVVAAVFLLCWLAALGSFWLRPELRYGHLLDMLAVVYIALALALAGSISLGEERAFGLAAWHLTLPVSARLQWLLKLGVGMAVAIVLGLVLPGLLAWATLPEARAGLRHIAQESNNGLWLNVLAIGTALWLFFVLSFWAATLLGNTMRAVLTAVMGFGVLLLCVGVCDRLAEKTGGLQTGLLCDIAARWQSPFYLFVRGEAAFMAVGFIVSVAALAQSLVQFRRPHVQRAVVVKRAALLLAIAFLAAFWGADFRVSVSRREVGWVLQRAIDDEIRMAARALPYSESQLFGSSEIPITKRDLEKVFPLSARAKRWLDGASLTLSSEQMRTPRRAISTDRAGVLKIAFPNGAKCELYFY